LSLLGRRQYTLKIGSNEERVKDFFFSVKDEDLTKAITLYAVFYVIFVSLSFVFFQMFLCTSQTLDGACENLRMFIKIVLMRTVLFFHTYQPVLVDFHS
jgi:hypothetical protein